MLLALLAQLAQPAPQEYAVDAGHSIVEFSIKFAFTRVKGRFTQWKGTILYDSLRPANSSITAVFETKSLDTGWGHRDQHLKTSDFFDVEKFPTISFQSQRVRPEGDGWIAEGPLTMHGVTRQVTLPFHFLPGSPERSPESRNLTLDLQGSMRLARADFGILGGSNYNSWFTKARSATMGDSVDISFEVEAWRADAESYRPPNVDSVATKIAAGGLDAYLARLTDRKQQVAAADWPHYYRGPEFVARALLWSGHRKEAASLAAGLAVLFPDLPDPLLFSGLALAASGDIRASAQAYTRGKELFARIPRVVPDKDFPQDDERWYYLDQLTRCAIEAELTAPALGLARVTAELYPDIARAHSRLGEALALSGKPAEAQAAFVKALALDPMDTRTLEYRRRVNQ